MPKTYLEKVILSKQVRRADFLRFMPARQKKELLKQSSYLRGKRVVHINAVADGGGVAEILTSLIPYLRSLGVESDWYFISPDVGKKFFENLTGESQSRINDYDRDADMQTKFLFLIAANHLTATLTGIDSVLKDYTVKK